MRREERVTVQGPVKKQQPDGMSHRGVHSCSAHDCNPNDALNVGRWLGLFPFQNRQPVWLRCVGCITPGGCPLPLVGGCETMLTACGQLVLLMYPAIWRGGCSPPRHPSRLGDPALLALFRGSPPWSLAVVSRLLQGSTGGGGA